MPEFDLDYKSTLTKVIPEEKPCHEITLANGKKKKEIIKFYPGFKLCICTVRNPFSKIIRAFLPSLILDVFLYFTF